MDGGYYAIKGFAFQIDKAILEILNSTDENNEVNIEQIQDIGTDDFVMQIKYKETQDYTDSKIREPVLQLIEEFKNNSTKNYFLYCFFSNKNEGEENIDINRLNLILTPINGTSLNAISINDRISKITQIEKENFINNFKLIFAPSFQNQFIEIINKLKNETFIGHNNEEAIFYYSNIITFLNNLVINNQNPKDRKCCKKQIFEILKNGKKLIFNSAFKEYKGDKEYIKYIKSKFVKLNKNQENIIFIGDIEIDTSLSLGQLIIDFLKKQYKNATYDLKPITFIIKDHLIHDVKNDLIDNNIKINDGCEKIKFNQTLFFDKHLIERKKQGKKYLETIKRVSFDLRILSESNFDNITDYEINYSKSYFFTKKALEYFKGKSYMEINGLNTKQIGDILSFN